MNPAAPVTATFCIPCGRLPGRLRRAQADDGSDQRGPAGHWSGRHLREPEAELHLYALGARGELLYKSVDDGTSWHRADRHGLAKVQYDSQLLIDPTDTRHLLITLGTGLYSSSNASGTWTPVLPGPADRFLMIAMDPHATSHLYGLDHAYSVLGSVDGGQHWTTLNTGRPPFSYADAPGYPQGTPTRLLQLDPTDSATLYLADYGLYKLTQSPAP